MRVSTGAHPKFIDCPRPLLDFVGQIDFLGPFHKNSAIFHRFPKELITTNINGIKTFYNIRERSFLDDISTPFTLDGQM